MKYSINFEKNPTVEDTKTLRNELSEYAKNNKSRNAPSYFGFFIKDENNLIAGGCNGDILHGCLHVRQLWVTEKLRSHGYGKKLIELSEDHARSNNCKLITLNTYNSETLEFYKKLGFYIEFERQGFEKNIVYYFLRKDLKNLTTQAELEPATK